MISVTIVEKITAELIVESIKKILPDYGKLINEEIKLTGLIGEAREHVGCGQPVNFCMCHEFYI